MAKTGGGIVAEFIEVVRAKRRMCNAHAKECSECKLQGNCSLLNACGYSDDDVKKLENEVMLWAAEHPEPVYPTWVEWLSKQGFVKLNEGQFVRQAENEYIYECKTVAILTDKAAAPIPADIAQKLGIEPKKK